MGLPHPRLLPQALCCGHQRQALCVAGRGAAALHRRDAPPGRHGERGCLGLWFRVGCDIGRSAPPLRCEFRVMCCTAGLCPSSACWASTAEVLVGRALPAQARPCCLAWMPALAACTHLFHRNWIAVLGGVSQHRSAQRKQGAVTEDLSTCSPLLLSLPPQHLLCLIACHSCRGFFQQVLWPSLIAAPAAEAA